MPPLTVTVMVPMGSDPGDTFMVDTEWGQHSVVVPEGVDYGDEIEIEIEAPASAAPAAAEVVPLAGLEVAGSGSDEPHSAPAAMGRQRSRTFGDDASPRRRMKKAGGHGDKRRRSSIAIAESLAKLENSLTSLKDDVETTSVESKTNMKVVEQARRLSMAKSQALGLQATEAEQLEDYLARMDAEEEAASGGQRLAGVVTSVAETAEGDVVALGYVRTRAGAAGTKLATADGVAVEVVDVPLATRSEEECADARRAAAAAEEPAAELEPPTAKQLKMAANLAKMMGEELPDFASAEACQAWIASKL